MKLRLPIVKPDWIEYLFRNPSVDPDSEESISFMKTCLINEITDWTVSTTGFTAAEQALIVDRIKHLGMWHEQIKWTYYLSRLPDFILPPFSFCDRQLPTIFIGGNYIPSLPSSATCLIVKDLSVDSAKVVRDIRYHLFIFNSNTLKSTIINQQLKAARKWKMEIHDRSWLFGKETCCFVPQI